MLWLLITVLVRFLLPTLIELHEWVRLLDSFGLHLPGLLDRWSLPLEHTCDLLATHERSGVINRVGPVKWIFVFASLERESPIKHVFN